MIVDRYAYDNSIVMNIGWIPGCTTYESLPADNPMGHSGDDTKNYVALLIDTYNSCTSAIISMFLGHACFSASVDPRLMLIVL